MVGFPAKYCRVVASRVNGDDAYVLIETGSDGNSYLYGVSCIRRDGGWHEGASGNAGGWSPAGPDDDALGTLTFWDEAPRDADMVRIVFGGETVEEPVVDGAYLAVWWRTPFPNGRGPRIEAFRINGEWRPPAWFECL